MRSSSSSTVNSTISIVISPSSMNVRDEGNQPPQTIPGAIRSSSSSTVNSTISTFSIDFSPGTLQMKANIKKN
jgi:hypothetical protein